MTSREIRQQFLDFFRGKDHAIVPSSPVVPPDDATLMFTNAGMNQFKDVFLAQGRRSYTRAADTQKCIRAGGKHNDLDNVGQDTYHHTFFEMLGNWSFGDYFKAEAIQWGWELLTDLWGIDKSRLHVTYFQGDKDENLEPDDEAARLWKELTDIDPSCIHPGGKKDNFWEMGETGPCGPCSEIHIDLTPDKSGAGLVNAGDHRVIEIWNLVFIQFNRDPDGVLAPLPAKHVDTGMGFERICAVLMGKTSNYDTDVWTPVFEAIQQRTHAPDYRGTLPSDDKIQKPALMVDVSYRVVADHVRCLVFALTDGAVPSNEGRGYVLRRILRRAVRYGRQYFNMHEPFLCDLVIPLAEQMGDVFPELLEAHGGENVARVIEMIRDEEESFGRTLDRGIKLFDEAADYAVKHHHGRINGEDAFKLHDTYGFPIDLTELMADERGLSVNIGEYERLMDQARERARQATTIEHAALDRLPTDYGATAFEGYSRLTVNETWVEGLLVGEKFTHAERMNQGQTGALVLASTPFYVESGGQAGDVGTIQGADDDWVFRVSEVVKRHDTYFHFGHCQRGAVQLSKQTLPDGSGRMTARARASVDEAARQPTMKNHTATHLLNWALREVLGASVQQKGSLVDAEKTRFDFSHGRPLTHEEASRIEDLVNEMIKSRLPVQAKEVELGAARLISSLRAVFGEKYADTVRVVSAGADIDEMIADPENPRWMKYAVELCGGTHLSNTGDVEQFALVSEEAVAKGVRRVVGVTSEAARRVEANGRTLLEQVNNLSGDSPDSLAGGLAAVLQELSTSDLPIRVRHELQQQVADLQKTVKEAQKRQASAVSDAVGQRAEELLTAAEVTDGVTVVVGEVPAAAAEALRTAIDWIRNKTDASAVLLATAQEGRVVLVAGMSKAVVARGLKAGVLIKEVAPVVGGRGGGSPDMAQGGGNNPSGIGDALDAARKWIRRGLCQAGPE